MDVNSFSIFLARKKSEKVAKSLSTAFCLLSALIRAWDCERKLRGIVHEESSSPGLPGLFKCHVAIFPLTKWIGGSGDEDVHEGSIAQDDACAVCTRLHIVGSYHGHSK